MSSLINKMFITKFQPRKPTREESFAFFVASEDWHQEDTQFKHL